MPPPPLPKHFTQYYRQERKARGRKRLLIACSLGVALFAGLIGLGQQYLNQRLSEKQVVKSQRAQDRALKNFLQDQSTLQAHPFFSSLQRQTQNADAGPYLNSRLPWKDSQETPLSLTADLITKIKAWKGDFLKYSSEVNFDRVDLTWLSDLKKFDHWNIDLGSPIEDLYFKMRQGKVSPNYFLTKTPTPDFQTLLRYVNLRWMKAELDGDYASAGEETRHLARLLYSTEHFNLAFLAVNILGIEARVGKWLDENEFESEWTFIDRESVDVAARVLKAYPGYWRITTRSETLSKVFLAAQPPVGLCQAIREGIYHSYPLAPLLKPRLALEDNLNSAYQRLDSSLSANSHRCRLTFFQTVWKEIPGKIEDSFWQWKVAGNDDPEFKKQLKKIYSLPYARRALGYSLAQIGVAQSFKDYIKN